MSDKSFLVKMLSLLLLLMSLKGSQVSADTGGFREVKQALESEGESTVVLSHNVYVTQPIYTKGNKTVVGNGYEICRGKRDGKVYKGTLLVVNTGELNIKDVIISGESVGNTAVSDSYGRLLDVRHGRLIMDGTTVLKRNKNAMENSDGGGAVFVQQGGTFWMLAGTITENQNVVGGAGVRVEVGGTFIMKGGKITNNQVKGIGIIEGFDGRGGAICNGGKVRIESGELSNNRVEGFIQGNRCYGGVGGMLYNSGECEILGGTIKGNQAFLGGGIYMDSGSGLRMTGGTMEGNKAERGKNIYLLGKNYNVPNITGIYPRKKTQKQKSVKEKTKVSSVVKPVNRKRENAKRNTKKIVKQATVREPERISELETAIPTPTERPKKEEKEKVEPDTTIAEKKKGYLQFYPVEQNQEEGSEIWYFSAEDIEDVKVYMKLQKNPFDRKTNQDFFEQFLYCCVKGGTYIFDE